ncbi:hypothetical protein LSM04_007244 [Trypanosoma melophagium]|uniref:uncharacterized protein n=1 Tax=Trypanosoma melophagium TaxID=715481 RepID=UPI00351AA3B0|nr:hypothetical protein LSM04_007244 [Trypanosoma melophagium]
MTVAIGVSFDLLGTLLEVYPSAGAQYGIDMKRFLQKKGVHQPNVDLDILERNYFRALRTELRKDRAKWIAEGMGDDKMMPIGGTTEESVSKFWSRVVDETFNDNGAFCNNDEKIMSVLQESRKSPEWNEFLKGVADRFATPEPYRWLPEALPTLTALHEWREKKLVYGIQCAAPAILTNSDCRLLTVISDMVKRDSNKPLIGPLYSADMIGLGKPCPQGIFLAGRASQVTSMQHWIHVGDTEEDCLAAQRAGCHFLPCSPTRGPEWTRLREMLEEVCSIVKGTATVAV